MQFQYNKIHVKKKGIVKSGPVLHQSHFHISCCSSEINIKKYIGYALPLIKHNIAFQNRVLYNGR